MAAQAGPLDDAASAAGAARRAALATRRAAAAEADEALAGVVQAAHAATVAVHRRLDAIEDEINGWAQAAPPVDTVAGARELQHFLLAKQHELSAIITEARDDGAAARALLAELHGQYKGTAAAPAE